MVLGTLLDYLSNPVKDILSKLLCCALLPVFWHFSLSGRFPGQQIFQVAADNQREPLHQISGDRGSIFVFAVSLWWNA